MTSPGLQFRHALMQESPLQIVGVINAYCALLAERAGFRVLYLSGAGVANASYGLPDLGMTSLDNVLEEVRRVTAVSDLPVLVDIDTGWGHALNIARTIEQMAKAGAAAVHIEDQVAAKRCGHRPNKQLVETDEMVARIQAAVAAKPYADFVVMARTDALASEGVDAAIARAQAYVAAGADMIFAEALEDLEQYHRFIQAVSVPVLANLTEFGKTPLYSVNEMQSVGVAMCLYPLSAFRAMCTAAEAVYQTIREQGTQAPVVELMQTRDELYEVLGYLEYEKWFDSQ